MRLRVLELSRGRTPWADEAAKLYLERIARMARVEETCLRPADAADPEQARLDEARRVLAALRPGERVVALDERGRMLDTPGFRDLLGEAERGAQTLVFLIGGAFGHHPSVRERAAQVVSLSGLVLNHQVARVVLLEQIYRGMTLLRGLPYHH